MCWQDSERKTGIWKEILQRDDADRMMVLEGTCQIAAHRMNTSQKMMLLLLVFLMGRTKQDRLDSHTDVIV